MKVQIPFDAFDYFAILSSGIVSVLMLEVFVFDGALSRSVEGDLATTLLLFGLSYVLGQISAGLASMIYERVFVRGVVGVPTGYLLRLWRPGFLGRTLAGNYTAPLAPDQIRSVRSYAQRRTFALERPRTLFGRLYTDFRMGEAEDTRLTLFRKQYHMMRNVSFVLVAWGVVLVGPMVWDQVHVWLGYGVAPMDTATLAREAMRSDSWDADVALALASQRAAEEAAAQTLAIGITLLAVGLLLVPRYLKFLRLFQIEVLTWVAAQESAPPKSGKTGDSALAKTK